MAWYGGRHQISTAWCWMMIAAVTVESKGLCMDMDPMQYCSVESLTCGSWPARQWTQVSVGGALFILRLCLDLSARSISGPAACRVITHRKAWSGPADARFSLAQTCRLTWESWTESFLFICFRIYIFFNKASEYSKRMPYTMPEPDKRKSNSLYKSH